MKNAVFWVMKTQFVPHMRHIRSRLEPRWLMLSKIEVFTAVNMKNAVFWDMKTQFVPHMRH
jgi:hypothetical protein